MITGNGLIARAFAQAFSEDDSVLLFARGVSNSGERDAAAFRRERHLLDEALAVGRPVVYFSSCGLVNNTGVDTPYLAHKRQMESVVLSNSRNLVLRLPQVVGITENQHTLTNFLNDRISRGRHFSVWRHAERNLMDVEDIASIGTALIREPRGEARVISIAAPRSLPMPEIVSLFERVLDRTAHYDIEERGESLHIDTTLSSQVGAELGIDLLGAYAERVTRKYYGR